MRSALRAAFAACLFEIAVGGRPRSADAGTPSHLGRLVPSALGAQARGVRIRRFAEAWRGTPYVWGGTSRGGIDCSAYLREMYRDLFRVELPRTTRQQIGLGVDLALRPRDLSGGLEPGDLIFYVDRAGVPNHVVVYAGEGLITHSVSGRGVVIEPIDKIYGRRVVARRLLVPARGSSPSIGEGYAPIPAAGPLLPTEIPCPSSFRADRAEVRRYRRSPLPSLEHLGERALCDVRALAEALEARPEPTAKENAKRLRMYAEWLESLEALKGVLSEP